MLTSLSGDEWDVLKDEFDIFKLPELYLLAELLTILN